MKFKYPQLQEQYKKVTQVVQNFLNQFEQWSAANGLPEPVVTHVARTRDESAEIYWKVEQIDALKKGEKIDEKEARARARKRFSFHHVNCAVDLRDYIYTPEQLTKALEWMRSQVKVGTGDGQWEILGHDVGSGHHFHVGFRDMARYHAWLKEEK